MDAVAARAGVSKATIYRWWPNKQALALDTLYHEWDTAGPSLPETGALRSDLLDYLHPWVRQARSRPFSRVITELLVEVHADPEFSKRYQATFVEPRRVPVRCLFERAVDRGEIGAIDIEFALDLVFGPIYHRLLHRHMPLNKRFIEQVVDASLQGLHGERPATPAEVVGGE